MNENNDNSYGDNYSYGDKSYADEAKIKVNEAEKMDIENEDNTCVFDLEQAIDQNDSNLFHSKLNKEHHCETFLTNHDNDEIIKKVFLYAVEKGNDQIIEKVFSYAVEKGNDEIIQKVFLYAVEKGNIEIVKKIVDNLIKIKKNNLIHDAVDIYGFTALTRAAYYNYIEIVEWLLTKKEKEYTYGEPSMIDGNGFTALIYAVFKGNVEIVKLLLKTGKSVPGHIESTNNQTALIYAVNNQNKEIVELLLTKDSKNEKYVYGNPKIGPYIRHTDGDECTALIYAVFKGNVEIVKMLLETGESVPGHASINNQTALMYAVNNQNKEIVKLLLTKDSENKEYVYGDPKIGHTDEDKCTALMYAIETGNVEIVELLLKTGESEPGHKDKDGFTALMYAVGKENENIVNMLIDTGKSEPEHINTQGESALYFAYKEYTKNKENKDLLRILVKLLTIIYRMYFFDSKTNTLTKNFPDIKKTLEEILKAEYKTKEEKAKDIYYILFLDICKNQKHNVQLKVELINQHVDFMNFCNIPVAGNVETIILTAKRIKKNTLSEKIELLQKPMETRSYKGMMTRSRSGETKTIGKRKESSIILPLNKARKIETAVGESMIDTIFNYINKTYKKRKNKKKVLETIREEQIRGYLNDCINKRFINICVEPNRVGEGVCKPTTFIGEPLTETESVEMANEIYQKFYPIPLMASINDENYEQLYKRTRTGGSVKKRKQNKKTIRKNKNQHKNKRTIRKYKNKNKKTIRK